MKNLESKKIILTLIVVLAVVLGLTVKSFAEDSIQQINPSDVIGSGNSTTQPNNSSDNTSKNNTNTNVNTNSNSNKNTNSYNNTNLPSTGLKDYSKLFIVGGALMVIAIVAYKKVKYYKEI